MLARPSPQFLTLALKEALNLHGKSLYLCIVKLVSFSCLDNKLMSLIIRLREVVLFFGQALQLD